MESEGGSGNGLSVPGSLTVDATNWSSLGHPFLRQLAEEGRRRPETAVCGVRRAKLGLAKDNDSLGTSLGAEETRVESKRKMAYCLRHFVPSKPPLRPLLSDVRRACVGGDCRFDSERAATAFATTRPQLKIKNHTFIQLLRLSKNNKGTP